MAPKSGQVKKEKRRIAPTTSKVKKAQRRAYLKIATRVENWAQKFDSHAVLMAVVNGQVLLAGSKELKAKFNRDNHIKEAVLQVLFDEKSKVDTKFQEILNEADLDFSQCTYKFLRCFLSQALQVEQRTLKPQYKAESLKPEWWPDDLRFISPNHPPGEDNPLTLEEMVKIAESYQQYQREISTEISSIAEQGPEEISTEILLIPEQNPGEISSIPEHVQDLGDHLNTWTPIISQDGKPLRKSSVSGSKSQEEKLVTTPTPLIQDLTQAKTLSTETNLKQLAESSWIDFQTLIKTIPAPTFPTNTGPHTLETIPSILIDRRRQQSLKDTIQGFKIGKSSSDGNCLYSSINVILTGTLDARAALNLRLLSIIHASEHLDEYVVKFTNQFPEVSRAHQFLAAVASSSEVFINKPVTTNVSDLMQYILTREIMATAVNGSYSGFLQIQFIASALRICIHQHAEFKYDSFYELTVEPYFCSGKEPETHCHIMWVKFKEESRSMNHICPLFPDGDTISTQSTIDLTPSKYFSETCVMKVFKHCIAEELHGEKTIEWIQCPSCQSWYHGVCVGLAVSNLPADIVSQFSCCTSSGRSIVTQDRLHQLRLSDLRSVYHHSGISDAIIDFFTRIILPEWVDGTVSSTTILSVLVYESIKTRKTVNRKTILGKVDRQKDLIGFPCKPRDLWHWILVAVAPDKQVAYIFDSLTNTLSCSNEAVVKDLGRFFGLTLTPIPVPVVLQTDSHNCGIHVLHNCITLSMCTSSTVLKEFKKIKEINTSWIRGQILLKCFIITRNTRRKRSRVVHINQITLEEKLTTKKENGLEIVLTGNKGRGVLATKMFPKGDILCEYAGELISHAEALERESTYEKDLTIGCYLYFFQHKGTKLCVDATKETSRVGRLVNHSKHDANAIPKVYEVNNKPEIWLVASRDIMPGEEILFNYNENRKAVLKSNPWLTL